MDAALDAVLPGARVRPPLTAKLAASYAEAAFRQGRGQDAKRLADMAQRLVTAPPPPPA